MMNHTVRRAMYRRDLSHWIAHLRQLAAEQTAEREASIRTHGIAHPRTIEASRRLNDTLGAGRHLRGVYRASGHEARGKSHELRRATTTVRA